MELKDLEGKHIFTGVELGTTKIINFWNKEQEVNYVKFELDGITYMAIEDPDDGYRSYMSDLQTEEVAPLIHKMQPIAVLCKHKTEGYNAFGWKEKDNLLEFIDIENGNVFLTIGTADIDDYYPLCVFDYVPENLSINKQQNT